MNEDTRITVGYLRKRLEEFDDDAELHFEGLTFYRLKIRGEKLVQLEFNEPAPVYPDP